MLSVHSTKITPEILNIIAGIDEFKGRWNALEEHTTALNLIGDVAHFGHNFKSVMTPWKNKAITMDLICKLHQVMIRGDGAGSFKTTHMPIVVQHGEVIFGSLDTATPDDVEPLMMNLTDWLGKSLKSRDFHPLLTIAIFTAIFLQIGPFNTGNQKLVRLLVPLLMLKAGYSYAPYVSIEEILQARAEEYYAALKATQESLNDGKPDWNPWVEFFLNCLNVQKNELQTMMKKAEKNIGKLPILSVRIMELFQKHKRLQMHEIETMTGGKRSTIKLRLNELVEQGHLKRHGQARSTWYSKI